MRILHAIFEYVLINTTNSRLNALGVHGRERSLTWVVASLRVEFISGSSRTHSIHEMYVLSFSTLFLVSKIAYKVDRKLPVSKLIVACM